jgi:hypothetical protein
MNWKDNGGGDWVRPKPGNTVATCIRVIDIGTSENVYEGRVTSRRQSIIVWELPNQLDEKGLPLTVSKFYTASLGEKANLRKDLESWRGRKFTAKELEGFNVANIIGKPCLLNLIESEGEKGIRIKVMTVSSLPAEMPASPKPKHSTYIYDVENHDPEVWEQLSSKIQERISACDERKTQKMVGFEPLPPSYDDIPF